VAQRSLVSRPIHLLPAVVVSILVAACAQPQPSGRERLDPKLQPKFINALPNPMDNVLVPDTTSYPGTDYYHVRMVQVRQALGVADPDTGKPLLTTVWAYGASNAAATYPGPTIVAHSTRTGGKPVKVRWENALPEQHLLPVDTTVHCGPNAQRQHSHCRPLVRTVVHLHGGHVPDHSDGYPEAWFSPGFREKGPLWSREVYDYPNDQEAATLWYHDHAMGITRLNVYAGLAGLYIVRDTNEDRLQRQRQLPARAYDIPLLIQDRSFRRDGSLYYESGKGEREQRPEAAEKPPKPGQLLPRDPITGELSPSIEPEFFGDTILVNGKAWPVLEVEPRKYRFRILNGSNARFYRLTLGSGQRFQQVGSDGGFLNAPVARTELLLAPAERADVILDFADARLAGQTIILRNDANTPFPKGRAVDPETTGQVMAFRVVRPLSAIADVTLPASLRDPIAKLPTTRARVRQLLLVEGKDEFGRIKPMLGTVARGPLAWDAPISEMPHRNDVEIWSIVNATEDAHPVHLHLVFFQVIDRQRFDTEKFEAGKPASLRLVGTADPPLAGERGWKDTVIMYPGEVTRVVARFDLPGLYVWHCHILEHEDHEMMRPYRVLP